VVADAQVTRVPRQALQDALRTDAGFGLRWIGMLNQEVRRLRQQCERLSLKTVEARVLHLLRTNGAASVLVPSGGLKALACELGVTHEALYCCVAALEKRGLVTRNQGQMLLRPAAA
jgi:CRP/FNR family transcriptional regulator, dissimilatory nitrate respiration regulator